MDLRRITVYYRKKMINNAVKGVLIDKKIPGLYVAGKTAKEATTPPLPVAIPLRGQL